MPRLVVEGEERDFSRFSSPAVMALESLRVMGIDSSGVAELGGGGRGLLLSSPIRSSVRVSCALLGTPLRRVLIIVS